VKSALIKKDANLRDSSNIIIYKWIDGKAGDAQGSQRSCSGLSSIEGFAPAVTNIATATHPKV
jgi:hypothetical protein